jgi:hypothetical protein
VPDGTAHVRGKVIARNPQRKFAVTWGVKWPAAFAKNAMSPMRLRRPAIPRITANQR